MEKRTEKAFLITGSVCFAAALIWALFISAGRVRVEQQLYTFDLAAAYSDVLQLPAALSRDSSAFSGLKSDAELAVLKGAGLTSLIIESSDRAAGEAAAKKNGLGIIYKADYEKGETLSALPKGSRVLFVNNQVFDKASVLSKGLKPCLLELYKPVGYEGIPRKDILTAHTVKDQELEKLSFPKLRDRFLRSRFERRIGILYLKFKRSGTGPLENESFVSGLSAVLKGAGEKPGVFSANPYILGTGEHIRARQYAAFFIALFFPLLAFFAGMRYFKDPYARFFVMFLLSLAGGVIVSAVISDTVFMIKLEQFGGVKYALSLPVAAVLTYLVFKNRGELTGRGLALTGGLILLFGIIFAVASVRSGNFNVPLFPFEESLRGFLENAFRARPRAKEFLIGYPCLLLGLNMLYEERFKEFKLPAIILVSVGVFGLTSVVNTFCHAHIPFLMSMLRSVYGAVLGLLGGAILIKLSRLLRRP